MYSVKNNRFWGLQRQGIPAHSSKHNFGISFQRIGGKPQLVMGGSFRPEAASQIPRQTVFASFCASARTKTSSALPLNTYSMHLITFHEKYRSHVSRVIGQSAWCEPVNGLHASRQRPRNLHLLQRESWNLCCRNTAGPNPWNFSPRRARLRGPRAEQGVPPQGPVTKTAIEQTDLYRKHVLMLSSHAHKHPHTPRRLRSPRSE